MALYMVYVHDPMPVVLSDLVQRKPEGEITPGHINRVKKIEVRMSILYIFPDVTVSLSGHEIAKILSVAEASCSSLNCEWAA